MKKLKRSIASNNTTFDSNKEDYIAKQGKSDILENLKQKRNINDFSLSPQNEIIHFRNNFHNNIIKTKLEIKPNISTTQLNHLKNFIYTKPFSVIQCDKNIGTAIISNSLLKKLCYDHLSNNKVYTKLVHNPLKQTNEKIQTNLMNLIQEGHI